MSQSKKGKVKKSKKRVASISGNENENSEVWTYGADEPLEHEPWLFPQVYTAFRADQIPSLADNEPPFEIFAEQAVVKTRVMSVWTPLERKHLAHSQTLADEDKRVLPIFFTPISDKPSQRTAKSQESPKIDPLESVSEVQRIPSQSITKKPKTEQSLALGSNKFRDILSTHSQILEYILYYEKRPEIYRPVAVLTGNLKEQIPYELRESSDFVKNDGIIVIELINNSDMQMMRDVAIVRHSNDLVIISPKNESLAFVYGERSGGITFDKESVLQIKGILNVWKNRSMDSLGGGRHNLESNSGAINIVICDNNEIVLVDTNSDYRIDDESYLDTDIVDQSRQSERVSEPLADSLKMANLPFRRPQTDEVFRENQYYPLDFPNYPMRSTSIGPKTSTPVNGRGFQKTPSYEHDVSTESETQNAVKHIPEKLRPNKSPEKHRLTTQITRVQPNDSFGKYGETHSLTLEYIIYYHIYPDVYQPIGLFTGNILGQTFCNQNLNFVQNEGTIRIELVDKNDRMMLTEVEEVLHSKDSVRIVPIGEAICYVYGETCGGFMFGSGSELIVKGQLYYWDNNSLQSNGNAVKGENRMELTQKETKFVLCDDQKLVQITSSLKQINYSKFKIIPQ
jgi:hypothetical protein